LPHKLFHGSGLVPFHFFKVQCEAKPLDVTLCFDMDMSNRDHIRKRRKEDILITIDAIPGLILFVELIANLSMAKNIPHLSYNMNVL
jgi:hypothetical protein